MTWRSMDDFKTKRARRKPVAREHAEQVALFTWADLNTERYPLLQKLFAVPNGGHRHPLVGARLKAEGVMAGVFDIHLPVARGRYHGLWIEMKSQKGRLSDAQKEFMASLGAQGYYCVACHGWESAAAELVRYLSLGEFQAVEEKTTPG